MTLPARREDETPHVTDLDADTLAKLVADGDCKRLTAEQRVAYYRARCEAAGLDYRAQPFEFLTLNGKLVLYAKREAANQLASNHGIRCEITDQRTEQEMRVVTVRAIAKDGRQTDEIGVVNIANQKGDNLANAYMKAVTKAKRRAVLSVCGLGMLDETELETVPGVRPEGGSAPPALVAPRRKSEQEKPPDVPVKGVGPIPDMLSCGRCGLLKGDGPCGCDSIPDDPESIEIAGEPTTERYLKRTEWTSLVEIAKRHGKTSAMLRLYLKNTHNILDEKTVPFALLEELTAWCGEKGED